MKGAGSILLLAALLAIAGFFLGKYMGETEEEKNKYGIRGALIGAFLGIIGGLLYRLIRQGKHNTVNYILHHKRKRVYEGICYQHRLDARINEHLNCGKVFDKVIYDTPKPRNVALDLERELIKRFAPKYNVQHNLA